MATNPLQGSLSQPLRLNPMSTQQSSLSGAPLGSQLASQLSAPPATAPLLLATSQLPKSTAVGGSLALGSLAANRGPQMQLQTSTAPQGGLKLGTGTGGGLQLGTGIGGGLKLGGGGSLSLGQQPTSTGASLGLSSVTSGGLSLSQSSATTATSTAATSLGSGLRLQATTVATSTGVPTLSSGPIPPAGPSGPKLTYKKLEDQINKWSVELEEQERLFVEQAKQINNWDQLLIGNADKILKLNAEVEEIKTNQQRLENELDFITAQQSDLEEVLVSLEDTMKNQDVSSFAQHTDQERQRTYQLAESLDSQLKRMGQDLREIVEHLNTQSAESESNMAPIQGIAKILNLHMESLQWVDQNAAILKKKVEDVSRMSEAHRREQENSFRLAFE